MSGHRFRLLCIAGLLCVMSARGWRPRRPPRAYDLWPGLVQDIFNNRPINDGTGRDRDRDALSRRRCCDRSGYTPMKLPSGDTRRVKSITLVIDQNPAPMAAKFELGPDANVSEISTRVRVNNYTDVHASPSSATASSTWSRPM